jgi:hypothetical protein
MDPTLAITFTRIGLIFDFLAFFLAAPEIIGEEGLKKLLSRLKTFLWWFGLLLFLISALGFFSFFILLQFLVIDIINTMLPFSSGSSLFESFFKFPIIAVLVSASISWLPLRIMKLGELISNSQKARRLLLTLGILLFVGGAASQFIGTF